VSELDILGHFGLTRIRVNIANAAVFGLKDELGLVGNEYNVALVILFVLSLNRSGVLSRVLTFPRSFVPYIAFEIPGNFLLKRFRPRVWCKSRPIMGRIRFSPPLTGST